MKERLAAALVAVLLGAIHLRAWSDPPDQVRTLLAALFALGAADFAELSRGGPVARTLQASDGREVSTLGVIRLGVPPAFYVEQMRDIAAFKKGEAVPQIGTFSQPAVLGDVKDMALGADDVQELKRCRPGDCKVQLSSDAILRFQRDVAWTSPDAASPPTR